MSASGPDAIFSNPRLAEIYDIVDGARDDLDHYEAMVDAFGARSVLDVGCGTGTLACRLARRGIDVVGVDPAVASLRIARSKPGADGVRWICGDVASLPKVQVDAAFMTGNVAQVFLEDEAWMTMLLGVRHALRPRGHFVFESRDPARRAWEAWTPDRTRRVVDVDGLGRVETWATLLDVSWPLVSFRHTYRFQSDGATLSSDSTLRFRDREELDASLVHTGFEVVERRDAPDRPGMELVYVARRASSGDDWSPTMEEST